MKPLRGVGGGPPRLPAAVQFGVVLVGLAGALRVAELEQLNVQDVVRVPQGLVVTLPRSKTDQVGEGHTLGIEPSSRILAIVSSIRFCSSDRRPSSLSASVVAWHIQTMSILILQK